ncbi:hypothetical protein EVAR_98547_1 [Eumeta japonica]|uniref:Uncharacterized protein n=1 Tax=Eumeta variegata TaxID=151549 RepID=A0A4C1YMT7_EUMVA|nr:hypothetical protein EVAR_98547_1 [Eumeta japonica]
MQKENKDWRKTISSTGPCSAATHKRRVRRRPIDQTKRKAPIGLIARFRRDSRRWSKRFFYLYVRINANYRTRRERMLPSVCEARAQGAINERSPTRSPVQFLPFVIVTKRRARFDLEDCAQ